MSIKTVVGPIQRSLSRLKMALSPTAIRPPYTFTTQIGDPVLRAKAVEVAEEEFGTEELNQIIDHLKGIIKKDDALGIAAPQIGVPLRVFAARFPENYANDLPDGVNRGLTFPLTIFINPKLVVEDNQTVSCEEGCLSVYNYQAVVPRFMKIRLDALNEQGENFSFAAAGYAARIIQHEMDHLDGILYVDRASTKTLEYVPWRALTVDTKKGGFLSKMFRR